MPNKKMERFTARARRILSLAQQATEERNHSVIGTEHLLMALLREEGGVAGRVLRDLGLQERHVEQLIDAMTTHTARVPNSALDLSPGTKRVLELAVDEARRMGHHYLGTEHLLLALVRQTDGTAIGILKRCDITPEEVRRQTRKVLQEGPIKPAQPTPPVEVPSQPARVSAAKNPTLQVSVTDTQTGTVKFDLALPLNQVEAILDAVYDLIDAGENGKVVVDDSDHAQRIEIHIDNNEQSESGDSDAH